MFRASLGGASVRYKTRQTISLGRLRQRSSLAVWITIERRARRPRRLRLPAILRSPDPAKVSGCPPTSRATRRMVASRSGTTNPTRSLAGCAGFRRWSFGLAACRLALRWSVPPGSAHRRGVASGLGSRLGACGGLWPSAIDDRSRLARLAGVLALRRIRGRGCLDAVAACRLAFAGRSASTVGAEVGCAAAKEVFFVTSLHQSRVGAGLESSGRPTLRSRTHGLEPHVEPRRPSTPPTGSRSPRSPAAPVADRPGPGREFQFECVCPERRHGQLRPGDPGQLRPGPPTTSTGRARTSR